MSDRDEWGADDDGWKDAPEALSPSGPSGSDAPTRAIPVEGDPDYLGPEYDDDLDGDDGGPAGPPPPDGYEEDGGGPSNRGWLLVAAVIAVLLLGVAAAAVVATGDDDDGRESASDVDTDDSTTTSRSPRSTSTTRELGLPGATSSTTIGVPGTTSTTRAGGGGGGTTSTTRRASGATTTTPVAPLPTPCGPQGTSAPAPNNLPMKITICTDSLPAQDAPMKFIVKVVDEDATISSSCVRISFEGEAYGPGCGAHAPTGDFNETFTYTHTFAAPGTYTVRAAAVSEPGTAKGSAAETSFTFTVV